MNGEIEVAAEEQDDAVRKCEWCGEGVDVKAGSKCASCREARYCSKTCQQSDWPTHKIQCAKHQGNAAFRQDEWQRAVQYYRKGILAGT